MVATVSERLPEAGEIVQAADAGRSSSGWFGSLLRNDKKADASCSWDGGKLVFEIGGGFLAVSLMPAPIPWSQLEGPCATAWWWPDAANAMRQHKYHFLAALMGGDIEPVERRIILTRVVSAVVQSSDAVGVYWGEGTLVHEPKQFVEMAEEVSGQNIPGMLWLDVRIESTSTDSIRCFTTGLAPLGFREIEVAHSTLAPDDLLGFIGDTACYIVNGRKQVNDGETIGRTATEQYKVRFAPSMFNRGEVMRLEMA